MFKPMADAGPLHDFIEDARETAREQLYAAWQIEVERLHEQLKSGWRGHIERVFDERFTEMAAKVEEQYQAAIAEQSGRLQRDVSDRLNQAVRQFRTFENDEQWSRALVQATEGFAARAALFVVQGMSLKLQASRGMANERRIDNTPLASAPAFEGVITSRDRIVALRTKGELSEPVADLVGEDPGQRFYLFPLSGRERVSAVLYADSGCNGEMNPSAVELLATVASAVLESQSGPGASNLVRLATPRQKEPSITSWFSLTADEQELHLRAQRMARVQAAEMRLYKAQAVKEGRLNRNLYGTLKPEIDGAREAFRRDFLSASHSMVDYLHLELLRTLANDDNELLGPDYPGPLA